MFHWTVTAEDFTNLTQAIEAIIVAATALVSAIMILWGIVRKILVATGVIKTPAQ